MWGLELMVGLEPTTTQGGMVVVVVAAVAVVAVAAAVAGMTASCGTCPLSLVRTQLTIRQLYPLWLLGQSWLAGVGAGGVVVLTTAFPPSPSLSLPLIPPPPGCSLTFWLFSHVAYRG